MKTLNQTEKDLILNTIKAHLKNPKKVCCSSEAAWVAQDLRNEGHVEIAAKYWSWVCCNTGSEQSKNDAGEEIFTLQKELDKIGSDFVMPSWGTYGT